MINTELRQQQLHSIQQDVAALVQSYQQAGLLDEETQSPTKRLIGERGDLLSFRRTLLLIDALLRNTIGWQVNGRPDQPRHAVVFGGTQVGKSTCVNVLLGGNVARVHHLGGFTRHAQAFVPKPYRPESLLLTNPSAFQHFKRVLAERLQPDVLDAYAIEPFAHPPLIADLVVWDAPDCDAVGSGNYLAGLIEALSLADVVVYVTTKEKYAVDMILEWVLLLQEAGFQIVNVLNNTPNRQQQDVLTSQRDALNTVAQRHGHAAMPLDAVAFPVVNAHASNEVVSILSDPQFAPANALRQKVRQVAFAPRMGRAEAALQFAQHHLPKVLAPALIEIESLATWNSAVENAVQQFVTDYQQNYLDDPHRYDAFTRVSVRILDLLNPPIRGLKESLSMVRSVLRLPARAIIWVGKQAWNRLNGTPEDKPAVVPAEIKTYTEAHATLLNTLSRVIETERLKVRHHPFWDTLGQHWAVQLTDLQREFQERLDAHWREMDQRIEATAQAIYAELEKNPTQLNLLRASRLGIDAAAIVISLVATMHTGGVFENVIQELIVAPAMLSFIEGLSHSVASNYVDIRKADFKTQLLKDTRALVDAVYRPTMQGLADRAIQTVGFVGMDAAALRTLTERVDVLVQQF